MYKIKHVEFQRKQRVFKNNYNIMKKERSAIIIKSGIWFILTNFTLALIIAIIGILFYIRTLFMKETTIMNFAIMIVIVTVVFNGIFCLLFHKTEEFSYLKNILLRKLGKA